MRTLTGLQPSGRLHVGNYFGAMRPAVELQEEGEAFYFIADYHAMTTTHDPAELRENVRGIAVDFLACGLDPGKAVFWRQSDIPEVNELAWILSTACPMGLLQRCHSYKDKVAQGIAPSHALFAYPVLMAADILLYDSDRVPVGDDQKQHLEVTRDLVIKVNERYGEGTLVMPEAIIREAVAKVPGLDGQKMSKSYNNTIDLFVSKKKLKSQVMSVVTDSKGLDEPKDPDTCNVFALYKLFANADEQAEMAANYRAGGYGYGHAKLALLDKIETFIAPHRDRYQHLTDHPDEVLDVLRAGAKVARGEARRVMDRVRDAVGIL